MHLRKIQRGHHPVHADPRLVRGQPPQPPGEKQRTCRETSAGLDLAIRVEPRHDRIEATRPNQRAQFNGAIDRPAT